MKRCTIILGLLLCFVMPFGAQVREDLKKAYGRSIKGDGFVLSGAYEFDGRTYRYGLSINDFAGTPRWKPSDGKPPLSVEKAHRIATRELKAIVSDLKPWTVYKIELMKLPSVDDAWYYNVGFNYTPYDRHGTTFNVIVRLDGKAIPPQPILK